MDSKNKKIEDVTVYVLSYDTILNYVAIFRYLRNTKRV